MKKQTRTLGDSIVSFFKKVMIIAIISLAIGTVVFFNKEETTIEEVETTEQNVTIISDVSTVFDGLKDFSKREDVQKKVELVEKEAFLQDKKKTLDEKYQAEIAEIEKALDEIRGELSTS